MKLYTDTLTQYDLTEACDAASPAVYVNRAELVDGPNVRRRRFESVTIRARSALRIGDDWRSEGTGVMGGRREFPQYATYDEHGRWMAELFERDPNLRIKSAIHDFDGRDSFHRQTDSRYSRGLHTLDA